MRRLLAVLTAGSIAVVIAAGFAVPAFGGPSYASLLRRITQVDKREAANNTALRQNMALLAQSLLTKKSRLDTTVTHAAMAPSGSGFSGSVGCPAGYRLTGGGMDWGAGQITYTGYQIVSSAPDPGGTTWTVQATTGTSPAPNFLPYVYAVCASLQ